MTNLVNVRRTSAVDPIPGPCSRLYWSPGSVNTKNFSLRISEIVLYCRHPASLGGALRAIVTTRGAGSDGREAAGSVSLDAPTNGWTADAKSQGPDTPMLVSSHEGASARRVVMVANKPGAPGRLRISVKTVAQGMPVDRQHLWYLPPAFFSQAGHG